MIEKRIVVGRIAGHYGVKGWVKVNSYTEPREKIFDYRPWYLEHDGVARQIEIVGCRAQGKGLIVQFAGMADRETAADLIGMNILVERNALGETDEGQYYWHDLVGLRVVTVDGCDLGHVESLLATGANDVLVLRGERRRLIPFVVDEYVKRVDLTAATITVDWDPAF